MKTEEKIEMCFDVDGFEIKSLKKNAQQILLKNKGVFTYPENICSIGASAFLLCHALKEINTPENIKKIGNGAYSNCSCVKKILTYADEIDEWAFNNCFQLECAWLMGNLKKLKPYTFSGCNNLRFIFLPDSMQYVEENAFSGCTKLERVYCTKETTFHENAFPTKNKNVKKVIRPAVTQKNPKFFLIK